MSDPIRKLLSLLVCPLLVAACSGEATLGESTLGPRDAGPAADGDAPPWPGDETDDRRPDSPVRPTLELEAPEEGLVTEAPEIAVQGRVTGAAMVVVDGNETAVGDDGRFSVKVPLEEGPNMIVVRVAGGPTISRSVLRDSQAPRLTLDGPPRGLFLDASAGLPTLVVAGTVEDRGLGVLSVTVDGTSVPLDGQGRFRTSISPPAGSIHTLVVQATDFAGHIGQATRSALVGSFAPPEQPVPRAVSGFIQAAAIDAMEPFLARMIMEQGLEQQIASQSSGDFEIRYVRFTGLDIDLTPQHGALHALVHVYGLVVGFKIVQEVLFVDVTFKGEARADRVDLTTRMVFEVTPAGSLSLRLEDASVNLHGFEVDVDNFPNFLEDLLRGTIEDMAEGAIEDALRGQVIPELFDPSMLQQEIPLLGRTIRFDSAIRGLDVDPSGIRLELEAAVDAPPDPRVPPAPGALADPQPLPLLGAAMTHLQLLLADDLVNRVLHAVWRSGLLQQSLDELLAAQGGDGADGAAAGGLPIQLNVGMLNSFFGNAFRGVLDDAVPVGLRFAGLLPPVSHPRPDPERPLGVQLGDLLLTFEAQPAPGQLVPMLTVAVAAELAIGLTLGGDGKLIPDVQVTTLADLVEEPLVDLNDEAVEQFLGQLVAMLLPLVTAGGFSADLGLYDGVELTDLAIAAAEGFGYYLITANVRPAP